MMMQPEIISLSVSGAAFATGLSQMSIKNALARGELEGHSVGTKTVILRDDLIEWLKTKPRRHRSPNRRKTP
jgi:excisionase family DNA binding protein